MEKPKDDAPLALQIADNLEYLGEIKTKCLAAPGFLMFSAVVRDTPDGPVLDFDYRRFHVNIEDAKIALNKLKEEILKDFETL